MDVTFLGGAREVGRSALLVDDRLLLDFGAAAGDPPRYPVGDPDPEAVVVSHGHLDHAGAVPALLAGSARPPVHWTPPTRDLARSLARDTLKLHGGSPFCPFTAEEVARLGEVSVTHGYREPFSAAGYEVTLYEAGHVPGSAHVLVDDGETRLLYTGDFHTDAQRLVPATTARPDADAVICESTYADVTHEDRRSVEDRFVEQVEQTVWNGGTVVVPAFAVGRTQEVLMILAAHGVDCYLDGMGVRVTEKLRGYENFLRDAAALDRAASRARVVDGRDGQRRRIATENNVVVTTAGMLTGGPAMSYVPAVAGSPTNLVALTGYQVEGTPGRRLLETGRCELDGAETAVAARVEAFDFSAHADREGLLDFLETYRDATVLVNHGDATERFAEDLRADGYEADAPAVGQTVTI